MKGKDAQNDELDRNFTQISALFIIHYFDDLYQMLEC